MNVGLFLKNRRKELGLTLKDVAKYVGVSDATVSRWETGAIGNMRRDRIGKLAEILQCRVEEVMDIPVAANAFTVESRPVPIVGTICAGDGMYTNEQYEGMLALDKRIPASFCIRVKGDSMIGAGVNDGDIAIINKDFEYIEGNIYAVVLNGTDECTLKIVTTHDDLIVLTPSNPKYSVMTKDQSEVYIAGELVGIFRPCKKGLAL